MCVCALILDWVNATRCAFFRLFTISNDDDGNIPFSHIVRCDLVPFCFVVFFSLFVSFPANVTAAPRTTACFGTDATAGAVFLSSPSSSTNVANWRVVLRSMEHNEVFLCLLLNVLENCYCNFFPSFKINHRQRQWSVYNCYSIYDGNGRTSTCGCARANKRETHTPLRLYYEHCLPPSPPNPSIFICIIPTPRSGSFISPRCYAGSKWKKKLSPPLN